MSAGTRSETEDALSWASATELRDQIALGALSPVALIEHVLGRIEATAPRLHAFSFVDAAGARAAARQAEAAVCRGDRLGALHGVPVSVKDHITVAGQPTRGLPSVGVSGDATIAVDDHFGIERLRAAGAILIGKNTMMGAGGGGGFSEAAVFRGFNWDAEARNPWDTGRVPGWSSSGGAAAVAAGVVPLAIASDGGGSTRLPAAYCGIVGVHPTGGLIPDVNYAAPRAPAGITVGPLARSVADAALATQIMAGPDGRDPFCLQGKPDDFLAGLQRGVDGLRLAWTDHFGFAARYDAPEGPRVLELVRSRAFALRGMGALVEETAEVWEDFWPGRMAQWLSFYPTPGLPLPAEAELRSGFETRGRNWDRFRALFRHHDLILSITTPRIARPIAEWEAGWTSEGHLYPNGNFMGSYCSHTDMFNWLRFPAVSVPAGFVDGLPVGLQIAGPPGSDATIFRVAQTVLHAFPQGRRPPSG